MKVIAYVRASTEEQEITLSAQRTKLQGYAALYELEIVETITDAGESAKSLHRPGLQQALPMLREGKADGLLVTKLDRLTRNVTDWQTLIDGYFGERAGKQLFSVQDSVDTRTAAGRMVLNIILVIAQWERETIAERTREALQHKVKSGERCGRIRYGYDLSADGKTLIPNAREQEAIGRMVEWRRAGVTYRGIAAELEAEGYRTKEGRAWEASSVRCVLNRVNRSSAA